MAINISGAYLLGAGQTLSFNNELTPVNLADSTEMTILGSVLVQGTLVNQGFTGLYGWQNDTVVIGAGGSVTVSPTGSGDVGYGFYSGWGPASFTNNGSLSVSAGAVYGVYLGGDPSFQPSAINIFANTGVITVTGAGTGLTSSLAIFGNNSGSLTVTGANAKGAVFSTGGSFTNSGTITATGSGSQGIVAGNQLGGVIIITNSGTITAATAVTHYSNAGYIVLNNSGTLNGDVVFGSHTGNTLSNTGAIHGNVTFSGASASYDGRGGTVNGLLTFAGSGAANTAYLGNDGESISSSSSAQLTVYGGTGADVIAGGSGDDMLSSGGGNDTLTGGLGADTFLLSGAGAVTITDFSHAQGDKISLAGFGLFFSLADVLAVASQAGADTVISMGAAGSLTLTNVTKSALVASDFVFLPITVGAGQVVTIGASTTVATSSSIAAFTGLGGTLINNGSLSTSGGGGISSWLSPNTTAVFENNGTFSVTGPFAGGVGGVTTHNNGTFTVTSTSGAISGGLSGDVVNAGTMTIQGPSDVIGVDNWNSGGVFQSQAASTLSVTSSSGGFTYTTGVILVYGKDFENAGHITVTASAGAARGLLYAAYTGPNTITNSGTITVSGASSTGIWVSTNYGVPYIDLQNTGTITAQTAISYTGPAAHLTNNGTLNGDVALSSGDDQVVNNGAINGSVNLGDGANALTSAAGTITGTVILGSGFNTVLLGAENNTVALAAGTHHVIAGGGTNTASYAGAASGVTVSLALQGSAQATGVGTDTLSQFQNLVGSAYADKLTGDTGANVLTGGGGADTFIFKTGGGHDTISDFSHAQGDRIDLTAFHVAGLTGALSHAVQSGADTVFTFGADQITLQGVTKGALTAQDLIVSTAGHDVTGTGYSAVVFRDPGGNWGYAAFNASGGYSWTPMGGSTPSFGLVGNGDFNGDGVSDLLFRESATGNWGFAQMNGSGGYLWQGMGGSTASYGEVGVGDFNGDGIADIVFREQSTGTWGIAQMHGAAYTWLVEGGSTPSYSLAGTGDFNGDGIADILFHENSTGNWGFAQMNASGGWVWNYMGGSTASYSVVGTGDFNGDGISDILFRDNRTGDWGYAQMHGTSYAWLPMGGSTASYSVVSTGDYNGDGVADITFRENATGNWGYAAMHGTHWDWVFMGASTASYGAS